MVIWLERGADLHMAQLMLLPLTVSCFSKIQIGFTFLVPAHLGSPGKRAVKRVCVLHNSVGTTCTTSPGQMEVMELEGYSRPTYNKLAHSATTRSTVVGVIHKLTVDEFVDCTNTPTTCCGKIFQVKNIEITHMTLTTPTQGTVSHHKTSG